MLSFLEALTAPNRIFMRNPRIYAFMLFTGAFGAAQASTSISFIGSVNPAIEIVPEKSTGLDYIYVVDGLENVTLRIDTGDGQIPSGLSRFSNLGAAFAEPVGNVASGPGYLELENPIGNCGYVIENTDRPVYIWVVDYSTSPLVLESASAGVQDCDFSVINVEGSGPAIHYYTINGQQKTLGRRIEVIYYTQQWDSSDNSFGIVETSRTFDSLSSTMQLSPPAYCSTYFTVTGDRFLKEWGRTATVQTATVSPVAVQVCTFADQEESQGEGSNIIKGDSSGLGGSAPATISFRSYGTEGVIHNEWQLGTDPDFQNIDYRFTESQVDYTFSQEGTFYMRFIGSNADGSCEAVSDTYTITIGASDLLCPNVFSPNGDGVNDEWKVSYRSIVDFDCWIFDRQGREIIHLDSPDKGWDGKRGGKSVKPGVYYYVIQATGADGKRYKKSGDINILNFKAGSTSGSAPSGD